MKKTLVTFSIAVALVIIFIIKRDHTYEHSPKTVRDIKETSLKKQQRSKDKVKRSIASINGQSLRNIKSKQKKRSRYVDSYSNYKKKIKKGHKLKIGKEGREVHIVENFVALKKNEYDESFGKKVKFLNNYIIFEPSAEYEKTMNTRGVVQFVSTGDIGVLTGKINLQIERNTLVSDEFFEKYNVEIHNSVKAINFFYVSPRNNDEIYKVADLLAADENVVRAYVEILSNPVIPN